VWPTKDSDIFVIARTEPHASGWSFATGEATTPNTLAEWIKSTGTNVESRPVQRLDLPR
jgi:hypothetical protein